jgi:hypothetical protein
MLEDHSSRWSAAASPGGSIGLVLSIVSIIALLVSVFGLTGALDLAVDPIILYVVLGISAFTTFLCTYLLFGYMRMGYRIDPGELTIQWGLWSETIPFDEIDVVEPAPGVLGENATGWQPFWPGYYVGTRNIEPGRLRTVSTLSLQDQVLIARSNGELFAISPDRPQLFMEELARWLRASEAESTVVPESIAPETGTTGPSSDSTDPAAEARAPRERPEQTLPLEQTTHLQAQPGPVFGAVIAAESPAVPAATITNPESIRLPRPEPEYVGPEIPDEPDPDTARYTVITSQPGGMPQFGVQEAYQPKSDEGLTHQHPAMTPGEHPPATVPAVRVSPHPPFAPPKPVILPEGTPRREVLQPIVRIQRQEPIATSPAPSPMLHQDPISLSFVGIGVLTTAAMAVYIWLQFDEIPPSLTLHWNADGLPGRVGSSDEIWTLPLMAGLVLIANVGLAWSIAQLDRFAARLMLSSTIVVHIVTWIALLMILN